MIIVVQGVGETVFMLLSNILDIKGEGVGGCIPLPWYTGPFGNFGTKH